MTSPATIIDLSIVPLMDCMIRAQFIEILKTENIKSGLGKNIVDLTKALEDGCGGLEWVPAVGTLVIYAALTGIGHFTLSKVQAIALNQDHGLWIPSICFTTALTMSYFALINVVPIGLCHQSTRAYFLDLLAFSDARTYEMGKKSLGKYVCRGSI